MSNKKKLLFGVIILLLVSCLFVKQFLNMDLTSKDRTYEKNPAQEKVLKGPGQYVVGREGFEMGYYDISTADSEVDTNVFFLGQNQVILNFPLYKKSVLELKEKSSIRLTPSKFEKLFLEENKIKLDNTTGIFLIGKEIESGGYHVILECDDAECTFLVQTTDKKGNVMKSYTLTRQTAMNMDKFELEEGYFLQIVNMSRTSDDFVIYLIAS